MENSSSGSLEDLLADPKIWRGRSNTSTGLKAQATGIASLDRRLPGGGWPLGALTEVVCDQYGLGELRLFIPALAAICRQPQDESRWLFWLAPPFLPYAPALAAAGLDLGRILLVHPRQNDSVETLWAMEQALKSRSCAAVLGWVHRATDATAKRRLQLAAEDSSALAVLLGSRGALAQPSPAALRLIVTPGETGVDVRIAKCRGGQAEDIKNIDLSGICPP